MCYVVTCLVTCSTLVPLVVLVYPLVVLVCPLVVLVFPLVCPLVVLACLLVVSVCSLVVLIVLSVGIFITDKNRVIKTYFQRVFEFFSCIRKMWKIHKITELKSVKKNNKKII